MKHAIERDQSLPSTEATIFSVTKDKYFNRPSLRPFTDFLLAFYVRFELLDMVCKVLWDLISPYLLYRICRLMILASCLSILGVKLEIRDAYISRILVQVKLYQRQLFITIISHVL